MTKPTQLDLFDNLAAQSHCPKPAANSQNQLNSNAKYHSVILTNHKINFILRRTKRHTIGFTIDDNGLRVNAPRWVGLNQIEAALQQRSKWILEKLDHRQQRLQQQVQARTLLQHNGQIPYMGVYIKLKLNGSKALTHFTGNASAPQNTDCLHLELPHEECQQRITDTVNIWLQQQAKWWFKQRLSHFLTKSGLSINSWRLSGATTRWGSCSSKKNISLNWRLIHLKHAIIDYVIAHEVAHLREMNHSTRFWQEVERLLPEYNQARLELKRHRPGTLPLL